ncbi:MAG TPA: hypothetical protein PKZ56_00845 [Candidatus Paceibacterota bacterium]|nr:hypothetical protein [Candidatus Paceibacterota bacterium]
MTLEQQAQISQNITIGLFGTCGKSKWREPFIKKYNELGINYFNPQVDNWDGTFAKQEAEHLSKDQIILLPVTDETYGSGSLTEIGFSILQTIQPDDLRYFIVLTDDDISDRLTDKVARDESLRSRKLVKEHLSKLHLNNIYIVQSLDEMLKISLEVYDILKRQINLKANKTA